MLGLLGAAGVAGFLMRSGGGRAGMAGLGWAGRGVGTGVGWTASKVGGFLGKHSFLTAAGVGIGAGVGADAFVNSDMFSGMAAAANLDTAALDRIKGTVGLAAGLTAGVGYLGGAAAFHSVAGIGRGLGAVRRGAGATRGPRRGRGRPARRTTNVHSQPLGPYDLNHEIQMLDPSLRGRIGRGVGRAYERATGKPSTFGSHVQVVREDIGREFMIDLPPGLVSRGRTLSGRGGSPAISTIAGEAAVVGLKGGYNVLKAVLAYPVASVGRHPFITATAVGAAAGIGVGAGASAARPRMIAPEGNIVGIQSNPTGRGGISPELQFSTQGLPLRIHNSRVMR